jgi:hypothetical protein
VARECNSQAVANTLWAYAMMGRKPGERALGALEARAMVAFVGDFSIQERCQLHQYLLSCALDEGVRSPAGGTSQQLREAFESACRQAFAAAATSPSESQQRVSQALRKGLVLRVQDEYRCPKSGYSIDMLVSDAHARPSGTSAGTCTTGGDCSWVVEFDGPSHFLACGSPTGATLLKHRHLRQLGYALVVVPYWEWNQVRGDEAAEVEYLRGKLDSGCV